MADQPEHPIVRLHINADGQPTAEAFRVEPLAGGFSSDRKYRLESAEGQQFLLRVSGAEALGRKREVFAVMQTAARQGLPVPTPLEIGLCPGGQWSYLLLSWVAGADVHTCLPSLTKTAQYALGLDAGVLHRRLHRLPSPAGGDWEAQFRTKHQARLRRLLECGYELPGQDLFLRYCEETMPLTAGRPWTFQHRDFHGGNLILGPAGSLHAIDFDHFDFGDPWDDFKSILWDVPLSPHFAAGRVHGYFGGDPPVLFWQLLALSLATNILGLLPWAAAFDPGKAADIQTRALDILRWFDNFRVPVPAWYQTDTASPQDEPLRAATAALHTFETFRYTVIFARYGGQWLYARHKERNTWETAGGHIEPGETPLACAKRELFEETGAVKFDIYPAFDYIGHRAAASSCGQVFFADVAELGAIPPGSEMAEVRAFATLPDKMTYPAALPVLYAEMQKWLESNPNRPKDGAFG
ncbi:MAG: phosphotransferase [Oscillospiraceae bacterium]|nr:phosphotransferase [Oscillospiraceae bacterium]